MVKKNEHCMCGGKFPIFACLIFIIGILWFLSDMGKIAFKLPWWPTIVMLLSLGWIMKHKCMYKK